MATRGGTDDYAAGVFNVPYGAPKSANLVDASNLRACGKLLGLPDVDIRVADFRATLSDAREGDLVFMDPPYVTGHNNNGFIAYCPPRLPWRFHFHVRRRLSRTLRERR